MNYEKMITIKKNRYEISLVNLDTINLDFGPKKKEEKKTNLSVTTITINS